MFLKEKKDGNLAPKTYGDYMQEFDEQFYTDAKFLRKMFWTGLMFIFMGGMC